MHHPTIPKVAQNNSRIMVVNAETGAVRRNHTRYLGSKLIHLRTAIEHDGGLQVPDEMYYLQVAPS